MSRVVTLLAIAGLARVASAQEATPRDAPALSAADEAALAQVEADVAAEAAVDDHAGSGPSLRLYGFADFRYSHFLTPDDAPIFVYLHANPTFAVGNLNLYADGRIGSDWRSLFEVRFTYLPSGAETLEGTAWSRTSTVALDDTEIDRPTRWGGIVIERAYLEWAPHSLFQIRAGQFLSPYGIWNEDHGAPTVIPVLRPYVIGEELIPQRQTGLRISGEWAFSEDTSLVYTVTLSNGRGPVDFYRDLDDDKAIGGRLQLVHYGPGELRVGVAGYRGRYTDSTRSIDVRDGVSPAVDVVDQYDELALAADALFRLGGLHLQAEVAINDRAYTPQGRPPLVDMQTGEAGLMPDRRRYGAYFLVGYRTPWLEAMPFLLVEDFVFDQGELDEVLVFTCGLNARPVPSVVLKAQFSYGAFPGSEEGMVGEQPLVYLGLQSAWAF